MKLLLDENLSPTLVRRLVDVYPGTSHVRDHGLKAAPDPQVWSYAADNGCTIVTKDADFHHRSFLHGSPPKVIWIRLGNCSTRDIAELLITSTKGDKLFQKSAEHSFLVLA